MPGTSAWSIASTRTSRSSRAWRELPRAERGRAGGHGAVRRRRPTSISRPRPRTTTKPAFAFSVGSFALQTSAYLMNLQNELFFSPATFTNTNLDPTRRYGVETIVSWQVTRDRCGSRAACAYTRGSVRRGSVRRQRRARWFRAGPGASACPGTSTRSIWCSMRSRASFGSRRMDNDSANLQLHDSRPRRSSTCASAARSNNSSGRCRCRTCSTCATSSTPSARSTSSAVCPRSEPTTPIRCPAAPIMAKAGVQVGERASFGPGRMWLSRPRPCRGRRLPDASCLSSRLRRRSVPGVHRWPYSAGGRSGRLANSVRARIREQIRCRSLRIQAAPESRRWPIRVSIWEYVTFA